VIRPTGLVDPEVDIVPTTGQIDHLRERIDATVAAGNRVLVTTLTKKMAEDLTDYLAEQGVRVQYLHSDVDTMARIELLRELRLGVFDVLVGINLLREGLDLPEVALVAILDADKEGFLRSSGSLIQTSGRAARNVHGRVIMYADVMTDSMRMAISETARRRSRQEAYNAEHNITPASIVKAIDDVLTSVYERDYLGVPAVPATREAFMTQAQIDARIAELGRNMRAAAANLEFEKAASMRDEIKRLRARSLGVDDPSLLSAPPGE